MYKREYKNQKKSTFYRPGHESAVQVSAALGKFKSISSASLCRLCKFKSISSASLCRFVQV